MHQAAVSHRRKQERKRKIEAQNACAQVATRDCNRMPRTKCDVVEYPAILAERDLAFGAAVQIVKH
jgi:hypothetical protein